MCVLYRLGTKQWHALGKNYDQAQSKYQLDLLILPSYVMSVELGWWYVAIKLGLENIFLGEKALA